MALAFALTLALTLGCGSESTIDPGTDPDAVVWTQLTNLPKSDFGAFYPDWRGDSVTFTGLDLISKNQLRIGYLDVKDGASAYIPTYPGQAPWTDARSRWVSSGLVIYESGRDVANQQPDLYYRDVATGQDRRLMFTSTEYEHYPAPQPGGPGLAYAEGRVDGKGRLAFMADTALTPDRHYITKAGFPVGEPSWDPTGTKIAFSADSAGVARHIWWIAIGDTTTHKLTSGPYEDGAPQFSPDGTKILFLSNRSGRSSLWIVDPAGEAAGLKRVAWEDIGVTIYTPCWSPDGTRIMVSSNGGGHGRQLWILSNLQLQLP
jgi:WD40 repeat protein